MYYQVWLSAENNKQVKNILVSLVEKKLLVGGTIIGGSSRFWWKGKEQDMEEYCYVMGFTTSDKRNPLEVAFNEVSLEEVPMACFINMDGNESFLHYINDQLQ